VKIIIAHLLFYKLFYNNWDQIKTKIYFDLANYYFINLTSIRDAIEYFGCDKLIFGSDNPFGINSIEKTIDLIMKLSITEDDKNKILGKNIQDILCFK